MRRSIGALALLACLSAPVGASAGESAGECYGEGFTHHLQGRLGSAIASYTEAVERDASFVMAYQMRAAAYQQQKKYSKALQDYSTVIALGEPNFRAAGYYNRGIIKNITGDFAGADADFTQAITLDKKMAPAFFHRAVSRSKTGNTEGRLADFRAAARLGDHHAEAWLNRNHPGWREMPVAGGPS